jgi:hypothetical protein
MSEAGRKASQAGYGWQRTHLYGDSETPATCAATSLRCSMRRQSRHYRRIIKQKPLNAKRSFKEIPLAASCTVMQQTPRMFKTAGPASFQTSCLP